MVDMNTVAAQVSQTLTNYSSLAGTYYDMFYNMVPKDITVEIYDNNGVLQTSTIPNRAKDFRFQLNGQGSPENIVSGSIGTIYQDTLNGSLFIKKSTSGNTGWVEFAYDNINTQELLTLLGLTLSGSGSPEGVYEAIVGAIYQDTSNGKLYIKKTGTGNTGWIGLAYDQTINPYLNALPSGAVIYMASTIVPDGYIKANGAALSRSVYSSLFNSIGTIFGSGDGSTTFNVPDLRGEFIRGWDDGRLVDCTGLYFDVVKGSNIININSVSGNGNTSNLYPGMVLVAEKPQTTYNLNPPAPTIDIFPVGTIITQINSPTSISVSNAALNTFSLGHIGSYYTEGVFITFYGRRFGTFQSDDTKRHKHKAPFTDGHKGWDIVQGTHAWGDSGSTDFDQELTYTSPIGGSETRGRNVALLACIKY